MARKNVKKIILVLFVLFFGVFVSRNILAQEFTQEDYNKILEEFYDKASTLIQQKATNFDIKTNPMFPKAYTEIRAMVSSYSFNTNRAYITWSVNGKIVEQGTGKKNITFKTGDIGTTVRLSVSITTENGLNLNEIKEIKIGELDLLWQANTHTPPFYRGKALPTEGSSIIITALPQGWGPTGSLIYEWKRNFKNLPGLSGVGKNSISFSFTDISNEENIGIKVSTSKGEVLAEKLMTIKIREPEIVLYEESPLEGTLSQKALSLVRKIQLSQPEIVIRAEPYFFLKPTINSLSYEWTMNKEPLNTLSKPNTVGLNIPASSEGGTAIIELKARNTTASFDQITKKLQFSF